MRKLILAALAASATLSALAAPVFTGTFHGTGRACYGTLAIAPGSVTWLTTFSKCHALPARLLERDESDGALRLTYQFTRKARACRYGVLSLRHPSGSDPDIGWEVVGYVDQASFAADKASAFKGNSADMMSCYLTRAAERKNK